MRNVEQDEHIEQLWYMKEQNVAAMDFLKKAMEHAFDPKIIEGLVEIGWVDMAADGLTVRLTEAGEARARQLIRAHRLAERLIADVLGGGDLEAIACEFEHIVSPELVNGICTLLGHPKECPHGMPIPEGDCCKLAHKSALSLIIPLTDLKPGESARIAYINCRNDQQIHKLEGLCIRPGVIVKLHQDFPTYVIECEGASIALDKGVVANISVWKNPRGNDLAGADKVPGKEAHPGALKKFVDAFFSRKTG